MLRRCADQLLRNLYRWLAGGRSALASPPLLAAVRAAMRKLMLQVQSGSHTVPHCLAVVPTVAPSCTMCAFHEQRKLEGIEDAGQQMDAAHTPCEQLQLL